MRFAMDPTVVKKREYAGLAALLTGLVMIVLGAFGLLYTWQVALVVLGIGLASSVGGAATLASIPDLVHSDEAR
jgi:hypothetical protein